MTILSPYAFARLLYSRYIIYASSFLFGFNRWPTLSRTDRDSLLSSRIRGLRIFGSICVLYICALLLLLLFTTISLRSTLFLMLPVFVLFVLVYLAAEAANPARPTLTEAMYHSRLSTPFIRWYIRELYGDGPEVPGTLFLCLEKEKLGLLEPRDGNAVPWPNDD